MAAQQRTVSVLIVDESLESGNSLSAELCQEPGLHVVGTATNAAAALELFVRLRPEVVVVSICLSDRSGFDVLERIRRIDPWCSVILTTRYLNPGVADAGRLLGATTVCAVSDGPGPIREFLRGLLGGPYGGQT